MACLTLQRGASAADSFDLPGLLPHARADGLETSLQEALRLRATRDGEVRLWFAQPDGGRWDLSAVESVVLEIHNPTDRPQLVRVSVENENAEQLRGKCSMAVLVAAGQTGKAKVRIMPTPEAVDYSVFEAFMMYYTGIKVNDNTVNPTEIVRMVIEWPDAKVGEALTVRRIGTVARADGRAGWKSVPFFPFIDEFGQYRHADWPGKIYSEAQLRAAVETEQVELSQPAKFRFSTYGGWADGPQLEATGSFRVAKHEGKWWLIDPEGRLFWSHGATGVAFGGDFTPVSDREHWFESLPERDGPYGKFFAAGQGATYMFYKTRAWKGLDIQEMNLLRKYGADYRDKTARLSHQRLRSWGMNTMAAWSSAEICRVGGTPYTSIVHYEAPALHYRFADVFDPAWEPAVRAAVAQEARQSSEDPWNMGYFVDNERWFGPYPRGAAIAIEAFKAQPGSHSKQRMIDHFRKKYGEISSLNKAWQMEYISWEDMAERREPPDIKVEQVMSDAGDFGMLFVERYFSVCRDAVRQAAPKKMYLGPRFHGHVDMTVVELCGKYADVISYNIYDNPPTGRADQYNSLDLPILITEWGTGSDPGQTPFRGQVQDSPSTPAERAAVVSKYLDAAIRHPNIVGAHFFQFRDQPLSGRADGEALLRGFVNIADTPSLELIHATRKFAEMMYPTRHQQP